MSPRPSRAMKLIASGVTRSAAIVRSPSFSRSSSSTRITMPPARIASMARVTDSADKTVPPQRIDRDLAARGVAPADAIAAAQLGRDQTIDVLYDHVGLEV